MTSSHYEPSSVHPYHIHVILSSECEEEDIFNWLGSYLTGGAGYIRGVIKSQKPLTPGATLNGKAVINVAAAAMCILLEKEEDATLFRLTFDEHVWVPARGGKWCA